TLSIFRRRNKGLDHLGGDEVAVELIQLRQPEVEAGVVSVGSVTRVAAQVSEVLHQYERAVELGVVEVLILAKLPQCLRAGCQVACVGGRAKQSNQCRTISRRQDA